MASRPVNGEMLYLGIDGGGSKCRAIIVSSDERLLGSGLAGPANPLQGVELALDSITTATQLAMVEAGLELRDASRIVAGLGLAGVHLPRLFTVINEWRHPFRHMFLTTDLHAACLGSHRGQDGAVIVAGTGSCGFSGVNGKRLTLGAHGFVMGDKGSGAWMGLEAIKAVLLASDGLGPQTLLSELLHNELACKDLLLVEKMAGVTSREYAKLAPLVFEAADQQDLVATEILRTGGAYISDMAHKLLETQPPRLSLIGGISTRLRPWLDPDIAAQISPPLEQPEVGAIYYARKAFSGLGVKASQSAAG